MGTGLVIGTVDHCFLADARVEDTGRSSLANSEREGIMDKLEMVTYCGLCCKLCSQRGRIPCQANTLKGSMSKEGYDLWGKEVPGFAETGFAYVDIRCHPYTVPSE